MTRSVDEQLERVSLRRRMSSMVLVSASKDDLMALSKTIG